MIEIKAENKLEARAVEKKKTNEQELSLSDFFAMIDGAVNIATEPIDVFVQQIEASYKGLGIPALYATLSILANKSVFFIGGRGTGKTRLICCVPEVEDCETEKFDTFTMGELDGLCKKIAVNYDFFEDFDGVKNKNLVFKVKDFSTLSEYHREIFLTICSKICSDGDYQHITTLTPYLKFENCKLAMLIAIQPRLYSLLCYRFTQWDTMSSDRFTKFLILNPLREETRDDEVVATLPRKIPLDATIPETVDLTKLTELFNGQVSEGRAFLYARDYSKAIARFQGKTEVSQEDVDLFYKLFNPYLESFTKLQQRIDLDHTVTVSSGHLELLTEIAKHLEGRTKAELATNLMVTPRHIEREITFLLDKELIREHEKKYLLSTELTEFFNWYKDTFSATMSQPQKEDKGEL